MEVGTAGALRSGDPERIGGFELRGRLGEGGQGTVYLGADADGREVAIKLLHHDLAGDEAAQARFLREVSTAKQVRSFCTAQIIDVGVDDDRPYIVSEFVAGPSLRVQIDTGGPLSGGALERLAIGTATALVVIHQAGVAHRDLKPGNVLLGPDGPRVIDFGIAKPLDSAATISSRVLGTPAYMAPEQLRGKAVARPADVFSWATMIVYAACGRAPFGQDTIPAVVNRILHEEPDLSAVDGSLRDLLARCLAKEPAERPSAQQVLMALLGQEQEQEQPLPAAAPTTPEAATPEAATPEAATPVPLAPKDVPASWLSADAPTGAYDAFEEPPGDNTVGVPAKRRLDFSPRQWLYGGAAVAALVVIAVALGMMGMGASSNANKTGDHTRQQGQPLPSAPATHPTRHHPVTRAPDTEEPTRTSYPTHSPTPTGEPTTPTPTATRPTTPVPTHTKTRPPTGKPTVPASPTDREVGQNAKPR